MEEDFKHCVASQAVPVIKTIVRSLKVTIEQRDILLNIRFQSGGACSKAMLCLSVLCGTAAEDANMVETTIVPGPKALLETEHVLAGGFFGRIASATPLKDFLHHCKALLQKIPERDQLLDAEIRRQVEGLGRNGRAHGGPVLLLRWWLHIHARTEDVLLKTLEQTMTMTTTMAN